ncbi:hypothetical protein HJG40_12450 [Acidithiobacillus sp. ATCC 19703]|uniref:Uncharacterized protein n=1 Tax=Acidithiobacillus concretivorus TaxID=3063952 RepID=A0ABS5ZSF0_9PROT|nr:hypothetical protein [Acidithiobacillus concretivorus]
METEIICKVMFYMVRLKGLEPLTYGLEGPTSHFFTLFASTPYAINKHKNN